MKRALAAWRERNKRHFPHGAQSKRTAKECGGWPSVHTWVIGSNIYLKRKKDGRRRHH